MPLRSSDEIYLRLIYQLQLYIIRTSKTTILRVLKYETPSSRYVPECGRVPKSHSLRYFYCIMPGALSFLRLFRTCTARRIKLFQIFGFGWVSAARRRTPGGEFNLEGRFAVYSFAKNHLGQSLEITSMTSIYTLPLSIQRS